MGTIQVNIEPGSGILGTYKNQAYKLESAFAEFIDNSTQSFFFHREELARMGQYCCTIKIEIFPEYIRVWDDAFGMEEHDFRRALKLNSPPDDTSGRCEKGMGLKTSATCLGSLWEVRTTMLGSTNRYVCTVDVDQVTKDSPETLEAIVDEVEQNLHGTIIEIKRLNKKITENKIRKLVDSLSEMYSRDIRNGDLVLIINKSPVKYEAPAIRVNPETNSEYKEFFERTFSLDGVTYRFDGWVGIRKVGNTEFSGFTLFRKDRAIKMHYRPTQLVGKPNLYPYQRIIGEVNLLGDNWEPSYTKDELMWEGELEDRFIIELKNAAKKMIDLSSTLRKEDEPVSQEKQRAISEKVNKIFQTDSKDGIVIETGNTIQKSTPKSKVTKTTETKTNVNTTSADTSNEVEPNKVELVIQGTTYSFWFSWVNNNYDDGIKLSIKNEKNNEYDLSVNYGLPYFGEGSKTQKELELIQKMAITIASSIIIARKSGDRESYRTLSIINSVLKNTK